MRISILAAGAAGMYCGSCMRDNALASALKRGGHDVTLVPLYTPLKTDTPSVSQKQVFFGGVNAYLKHASRLFRHTPRVLDWLLDRHWLLYLAGKYGTDTAPAKLGGFTLDVLRGGDGPMFKELRRLMTFLRTDVRPEVVSIPNLMFIGAARIFREELKVPVVVELTGEDIFLDALAEPHRSEARRLIREKAADVSRFVATSSYYADQMSAYLGLPRERIDVVFPGLQKEFLDAAPPAAPRDPAAPPTVGFLARICPEKGVERFLDAMPLLRATPGMSALRVRVAGYLGKGNEKWWGGVLARAKSKLGDAVAYEGSVDQAGKLDLLNGIDVFSVPTAYPEPKGIYLLEAMAQGVPVVQPTHGSFPELIERTGGGLLTPPGDAAALAAGIHTLLVDPDRRRQLGAAGRAAVRRNFTDECMADRMLQIFQEARA